MAHLGRAHLARPFRGLPIGRALRARTLPVQSKATSPTRGAKRPAPGRRREVLTRTRRHRAVTQRRSSDDDHAP
jgi:hypothetical protein